LSSLPLICHLFFIYSGSVHFLLLPFFGCQALGCTHLLGGGPDYVLLARPVHSMYLSHCRITWLVMAKPVPPVRNLLPWLVFKSFVPRLTPVIVCGVAAFAGNTNYWRNGGLWLCTRPYFLFGLWTPRLLTLFIGSCCYRWIPLLYYIFGRIPFAMWAPVR